MLPSETMIWQPEFTDKTLSRKPGAVQQPTHRYKRGGHEHVAIPNYLERQFAVTYGYRRVWALLRRQAELDGMPAINAKRENLAEAFEHYNEWHPHSALGYRSPREYLRQQASNGLSDNRCLEI